MNDPVEIPDESAPPRSGQGRQMDARKRQAIDAWAMQRAYQHYENMGYALTDTSKVAPYDYMASKNGEQRRVEVKGLTGELGPVMVTAGEVRSAREVVFVADDGRGIPSPVLSVNGSPVTGAGVDIHGIKDRVRQVGGQFEIQSDRPGTTVSALIDFKTVPGD